MCAFCWERQPSRTEQEGLKGGWLPYFCGPVGVSLGALRVLEHLFYKFLYPALYRKDTDLFLEILRKDAKVIALYLLLLLVFYTKLGKQLS